MINNTQQFVTIQKLLPGTLVLEFSHVNDFQRKHQIVIDSHQEYIRIPLDVALSMFNINATYSAYKGGVFKFSDKDKELVFNSAAQIGLYYPESKEKDVEFEQPTTLFTRQEIVNMLRTGRTREIEAIINGNNAPQKRLLIDAARENIDILTYGTIQLIKEGLGLDLGGE